MVALYYAGMEKTPEDLLDAVCDRDTFIAFVRALAFERSRAAQIEQEHPQAYVVDGALDWKNADIPAFLHGCLGYFHEGLLHEPDETPNWRMIAEFLHCGKIIE